MLCNRSLCHILKLTSIFQQLCQNQQSAFSSPERVRIVRVLVKHIHSYSSKQLDDPASRSSALRKYARQVMCSRAYHYVKHLVSTWPLDASFRLVMELWLSLIQPWRYANVSINQDRLVFVLIKFALCKKDYD